MELKTYFAQDSAGNLIPGATVTIYNYGTTTIATGLEKADGTPLANPFTSDSSGRIQFRAPDGQYDMNISVGAGIAQIVTIQCVDYSGAKLAAEQAQQAVNSIYGINANFENNTREQWKRSLADAGVNLVDGSFEEGATLNNSNDAVWFMNGGQCYLWEGTTPKSVPEKSTPENTGGITSGAWVSAGSKSLRNVLASNDGAKNVIFLQSGNGAQPASTYLKLLQFLTYDDFIPESIRENTANVNCSPYIQQALIEGFATNREVKGVPGKVYGISNTILIPQNFDSTFASARMQSINGCGCVFNMLSDVTLFESGYYNESNQLISNFGTDADSYYSKYILLGNFTVKSSTESKRLSAAVLRIQDWHHGSRIYDIFCNCAELAMESRNNYYAEFDNLCFEYPVDYVGDRFVFTGFHNLCVFRRLIATNAQLQYRFDGPITSCLFDGISIEGCTVGLQFNSAVYDVLIQNSYIENVTDVSVFFNDYAFSVRFENNYVNFVDKPSMYFIGYRGTPVTEIYIDRSNHFHDMIDDSRIIKGIDNNYGVGITIDKAPALSDNLQSLLVDNTKIGPNVDVRQRKVINGVIGNVVNTIIPGNYAGKYSSGLDGNHGFEWVNFGNTTLLLKTAAHHSGTEIVYVNIAIQHGEGTKFVKGFFIGGDFFSFSESGAALSSDLFLNTDDAPFVQIQGNAELVPSSIVSVKGEIRIV